MHISGVPLVLMSDAWLQEATIELAASRQREQDSSELLSDRGGALEACHEQLVQARQVCLSPGSPSECMPSPGFLTCCLGRAQSELCPAERACCCGSTACSVGVTDWEVVKLHAAAMHGHLPGLACLLAVIPGPL